LAKAEKNILNKMERKRTKKNKEEQKGIKRNEKEIRI
jgi:hypothetical protein